MKKININHKNDDNHVRVNNRSTASLTALADGTRELTDKEFKVFMKLVAEYRKADRHADKWAEVLDNLILGARTLSNREWRQTIRFAKGLRKADRLATQSELVEKRAKQERFEQARRTA